MSPATKTRGETLKRTTPFDGEVVELALCLPGWQVECLEEAAHQRGLTAGQFLRRMIGDALDCAIPPSAYYG
jgi:hypothetical protein